MACCTLTALGWGVHPDVARNIHTVREGEEVLAHIRDFWRMACDECRRLDLLPVAREVELEVKCLR